jgi:3-oxoacid CoA-transferase
VSNPEKTKVLVVQAHIKYEKSKIKKECDLPITGAKCVHTIITDLAVFDVDPEKGLNLRRYNPLTKIDEIRRKTAARVQGRK